jgi:hypothetical protein
MAKKTVTIRITEPLPDVLKVMADKEDRSQGKQVEYLIKKEAKRLGIEIKKVDS